MVITKTRKELYSVIYIFSLFIYLLRTFIFSQVQWTGSMTEYSVVIRKYLMYFLMFLFTILLYLKANEEKIGWTAGVLTVSVCLFISYRINDSTHLLFTLLLSALAHNLSARKILRSYFWFNLGNFLITLLLCVLHLAEDRVIYFSYGISHSLGSTHPNTLAALMISIIISWQYAFNRSELNKKMIALFLGNGLFAWFVLRSRTALIISILYPIILFFIYFLRIIKSKFILNLLKFSVLVIFSGFYILMTNADFQKLFSDKYFISRFTRPYEAFRIYGIHLFGSDFEVSLSYFGDSAYPYLLISCGIIPTIIMIGLIIWICLRVRRLKMDRIFAAVFVFILQGLMEQYMFRIAYNPTFFFAFTEIDIYQQEDERIQQIPYRTE